jgi:hypothetical protein
MNLSNYGMIIKVDISYEDFRDWYFGKCDDFAKAQAIEQQLEDPGSYCSALMWLSKGDLSNLPISIPESITNSQESPTPLGSDGQKQGETGKKPKTANILANKLTIKYISYISRIAFILAFTCSLAGCVPMNAKPFYIMGLILAGMNAILAFLTRHGRAFSFMPVFMNIAAIAAWPDCIGFFPSNNGPTVQIGRRVFDVDGNITDEVIMLFLRPNIRLRNNERVVLKSDGGYFKSTIYDGYAWPWAVKRFPTNQTLKLDIGGNSTTFNINTSKGIRPDKYSFLRLAVNVDFSTQIFPKKTTTWFLMIIDKSMFETNENISVIVDREINPFFNKPSTKNGELSPVFETLPGFHQLTIRGVTKEILSQKIWVAPIGDSKLNKFKISMISENGINQAVLNSEK